MNYGLIRLRGCDERYTYELTRDSSNIDEYPYDSLDMEDCRHSVVIELAHEYGFGYRRWKND